jgi:hypothetical protein
METVLGRGYSINEESGLTDFYSPPSSIVDEDDDDLFYPEEEEEEEVESLPTEPVNNITFSFSSFDETDDSNLSKSKEFYLKANNFLNYRK